MVSDLDGLIGAIVRRSLGGGHQSVKYSPKCHSRLAGRRLIVFIVVLDRQIHPVLEPSLAPRVSLW